MSDARDLDLDEADVEVPALDSTPRELDFDYLPPILVKPVVEEAVPEPMAPFAVSFIGSSTFTGSMWGSKSAYDDELVVPPPQSTTPPDGYELLGEMVQRSPQMAAFIQQRATASRTMVQRAPAQRQRDFTFDFVQSGRKGDVIDVVRQPQMLFRPERMFAADNSDPPGLGTRIKSVIIGNRIQFRFNDGCFSVQLAEISRELKFATCEPANSIAITVEFLKDCTWSAMVAGKGIV